jgi:hypothetical protein
MISTKIVTRGLAKRNNMTRLKRGMSPVATRAAAKYLVGNKRRGLKHEPRYKTIKRKRAYGKTFFTDKQRKWFFWALRTGKIKPGRNNRTHEMSNGWEVVKTKSGANIVNRVKHAIWSYDNKRQARLNKLVGWRKIKDIENPSNKKGNKKGMLRAADQAVQRFINDLQK